MSDPCAKVVLSALKLKCFRDLQYEVGAQWYPAATQRQRIHKNWYSITQSDTQCPGTKMLIDLQHEANAQR